MSDVVCGEWMRRAKCGENSQCFPETNRNVGEEQNWETGIGRQERMDAIDGSGRRLAWGEEGERYVEAA